MGKIGKYIYGIINGSTSLRLFTPENSFEVGGKNGINEIYTIPYRDISALVRNSEIINYTQLFKDAVARLLVEHQMVIEKIMGIETTIIPMRLGTFVQDEVEVKYILNKGYNLIKNVMEKISDRIEIDIVATWRDFNSVLKNIGEEKEIKDFKENLLSGPKGPTIDNQIKVGAMVKKLLDEKSEKYAKEIQNALRTVSQHYKLHDLMDDKMVINIAFLINKHKQKDFDRKVEDLNTEFNEELNFRCIGPLPPYSFYTLELKKMEFEEIDWAREKLGLKNFITKDEIKEVYRAKLVSSHPDRNPNKPDMRSAFDDVNKAYNILVNYCSACEQDGEKENFSFEEYEKNTILVKVRE